MEDTLFKVLIFKHVCLFCLVTSLVLLGENCGLLAKSTLEVVNSPASSGCIWMFGRPVGADILTESLIFNGFTVVCCISCTV